MNSWFFFLKSNNRWKPSRIGGDDENITVPDDDDCTEREIEDKTDDDYSSNNNDDDNDDLDVDNNSINSCKGMITKKEVATS